MCGRYALFSPPDDLRAAFGVAGEIGNLQPRYNIAPTQSAPLVGLNRHNRPGLILAAWGWRRAIAGRDKLLINARSESAGDKPAFREALSRRRCLVPADAFYEWDKAKQPFAVRRADHAPFAMAGLWETRAHNGARAVRFVILTTQANQALAPIHHRMPVMLPREDWSAWLDRATAPRAAAQLLKPLASHLVAAQAIGARVNKVANDDAGLLDPAAGGA